MLWWGRGVVQIGYYRAMESIKESLSDQYKNRIKKAKSDKKRARVQILADEVHQALGLGEDYSKYPTICRVVKHSKEAHIHSTLSWLADYPNAKNKFRLFMWKIGKVRKDAKLLADMKRKNK